MPCGMYSCGYYNHERNDVMAPLPSISGEPCTMGAMAPMVPVYATSLSDASALNWDSP